jgi:hypothetical protein
MKLVLMRLEVAELTELLPTIIEPACERLFSSVDNFVGPDITVLGETFATKVTDIGPSH